MAGPDWNSPAPLFSPRSVAILGASERGWPDVIYRNLTAHDFGAPVYPVNPKYTSLWGKRCYRSISEIPGEVDQLIVLIPGRGILPSLKEGAQKGCRSAIVVSSGFAESATAEGKALEKEIRLFAAAASVRICGPNCVGLISVPTRFYPTTYEVAKERALYAGGLSLVSQSGGFLGNLFQSGADRAIGFRYLVSSGNEAGLDLSDYVHYFAEDPGTRVIALFIEGIRDAEKFIQACGKARERGKPVIAMKLGRSERAKAAALSHTGSVTGSDQVYDAVFRDLKVIRVENPDQLLETAALFLEAPLPKGRGVGVLTNSGGLRGMVCDAADKFDVELPPLSPETTNALHRFLSVGSVVDNPLDGGWGVLSSQENFRRSIELLLQDEAIDLLAMQGKLPEDRDSAPAQRYRVAAELAQKYEKPVVVFSIFSHSVSREGGAFKREIPLPFLQGLDKSLQAIQGMVRYVGPVAQEKAPSPPSDPGTIAAARSLLQGKEILTEAESKDLLRLYGFPCAREGLAASAAEAVKIAGSLGYPVALKVISPDIPHKTEAGGVKLNLQNSVEVERCFAEMNEWIKKSQPQAHLSGILVQEMVSEGMEVILGAHRDAQFGPIVLFGMGGVFVELLKDVAYRTAPLDRDEALKMIQEIKGYRLLSGFRGAPPVDLPALADCLVKMGRLAADLKEEIESIDINPLKALPAGKGAKVVDALAVLRERSAEV